MEGSSTTKACDQHSHAEQMPRLSTPIENKTPQQIHMMNVTSCNENQTPLQGIDVTSCSENHIPQQRMHGNLCNDNQTLQRTIDVASCSENQTPQQTQVTNDVLCPSWAPNIEIMGHSIIIQKGKREKEEFETHGLY